MLRRAMVIAPHPDDETLGCGGTILKHKASGDAVHWLIVTAVREDEGFAPEAVKARQKEIRAVSQKYGFDSVTELGYPTAKLDVVSMKLLVEQISATLQKIKPEVIYIPYRGDVHTDHSTVFDVVTACTKWFRYPFIKKVLAYETLSETDFALNSDIAGFRPNVFVDIEAYIEKKIEIMNIYASEMADFPFPRSVEAIKALAQVRGAASGFKAAEAFMLLKERCD